MCSVMNKKQANQSLPEESEDRFVTQVDNLEDSDSSRVHPEQVRAEELKKQAKDIRALSLVSKGFRGT